MAGEEGATDEQYRFARCAEALPRSRMRQLGVPLPGSEVTVLCPDLSWEELQVGLVSCWLEGRRGWDRSSGAMDKSSGGWEGTRPKLLASGLPPFG